MKTVDRDHSAYNLLHSHRVILADLGRLEASARDGGALDAATARLLTRWFGFFARFLHAHHEAEDADVFQLLAERDASFRPGRAELAQDHVQLTAGVRAVEASLASLVDCPGGERDVRTAQLREALASLQALLRDHLDREEDLVVGRMGALFTLRDMKRLEKRMARRTPLGDVSLLVPWVIDTCEPEDRPHMLKQIPLPLRVLNRLFWQRRYQKLTAPLAQVRTRRSAPPP